MHGISLAVSAAARACALGVEQELEVEGLATGVRRGEAQLERGRRELHNVPRPPSLTWPRGDCKLT